MSTERIDMEFRDLSNISTKSLLEVFNCSFADYMIPFQLNLAQLQFKIQSEGIDLKWSVGAFDKNRLVGFVLHGVKREEEKTMVYNAGTGVLPECRGRGLVQQMYDFSMPFLRARGVEVVVLEVIVGNVSAIRAYEKYGFKEARKLLCFEGTVVEGREKRGFEIETLTEFHWPQFRSFWDVQPSWQNDRFALELLKEEYVVLAAFKKKQLAGYLIFNPKLHKIQQLAVNHKYRRQGAATQLLLRMKQWIKDEKVVFNNIDATATALKVFLENRGLQERIQQLEMERVLEAY